MKKATGFRNDVYCVDAEPMLAAQKEDGNGESHMKATPRTNSTANRTIITVECTEVVDIHSTCRSYGKIKHAWLTTHVTFFVTGLA
jgi:hypothetical protein